MKVATINLAVRIKLSADAKILIFTGCVFILILLKLETATMDAALVALGGALVTGIIKDHKANELDVQVAEKDLGDKVTAIKQAARGQAAEKGTRGDPLK